MTTTPILTTDTEHLSIDMAKETPSSIVQFIKNAYDIAIMPKIFFPNKENKLDKTKTKIKIVGEGENEIKYMAAKDKDTLNQYYSLRNDVFRNECGWDKKTWFENDFDKKSDIYVAIKNNEVIGGLRLMNSIDNQYLSDENPGTKYTYRNLLKSLDLNDNLHYVEIDGFVVKKEHRDGNISAKIGECALNYAKSRGCSYAIAIASLATCRHDRSLFRSIGYDEVYIVSSFQWTVLEEYNNSRDFPIISVLDSKGAKKTIT